MEPASTKLQQALELMRVGFRLKRAQLRRLFPAESEAQIDQRLAAWLASEGQP